MRKLKAFVLPLFVMLCSCEKDFQEDEVVVSKDGLKSGTRIVSMDEIPKIKNYLKLDEQFEKSGKADDINQMIFDRKTIIETIDEEGVTNYSFSFIYEDTPENVFYNLIVSAKPKQKNAAYILKYTCDPRYFESFKKNDYKFDYFVGGAELSLYDGDLKPLPNPKSGDEECPKIFIPSSNPGGTGPLPIPRDGGSGGGPGSPPGSPGFNSVVVGYNYSAGTGSGMSVTWGSTTTYAGGGSSGGGGTKTSTNPLDPTGPIYFNYFTPWKKDDQARIVMQKSGSDCPEVTPPSGYVPVNQAVIKMKRIVESLKLPKPQLLWLSANPDVLEDVFKFLGYSPNDEKKEFAEAAMESLFNGGDVDFDYKVILDPSLEDNPCLMGVYNQLGGAPTFQNYLHNFDGDFSVANLKLSAAEFSGDPTVNAVTYQPKNYLIEIKFNLIRLNRPRLDIARTFIHEMIHAEIYRKLMMVASNSNGTGIVFTTETIKGLKNDFPGLYDYYLRYHYNVPVGQDLSDPDHQMMAAHYREIIKSALSEFDNHSGNTLVYEALSWVGLMGEGVMDYNTGLPSNPTEAWKKIPQQDRLNYLSIYNNYKNDNPPCQ